MPAGMATVAATASVLPPRTAAVAMKMLVVTAMAGAQTTINNELKAAKGGGPLLAATAALPPRTATVVIKTPAVTAITGAQTTINNQLNQPTAVGTHWQRNTGGHG